MSVGLSDYGSDAVQEMAAPGTPRVTAWRLQVFAVLFVWSLPFSFAVDSVNGWLLAQGTPLPVSALYKIALLVMGGCYLVLHSIERFIRLSALMAYLLALVLSHAAVDGRASAVVADMEWGARALLLYSYYLVFSSLHEVAAIDIRALVRACGMCWFIVALNLAVGIAGFGFAQYDDRYGTAGYFYAGNELALSMLAISVLPLAYAFASWTAARYIALSGVLMIAALLTLTKTAVVGLLLLSISIPAVAGVAVLVGRGRIDRRSTRFVAAGVMIGALLCVAAWWFILEIGFLDRIRYFFERGGWVSVIFSGRDRMIESVLTEFLATSGVLDLLVGKGVIWPTDVFGGQSESDFVDFAVAFGLPSALLAAVMLSGVAMFGALRFIRSPDLHLLAGAVAAFAILIILVALAAGHVLNSGMAATSMGAVLASWRVARVPIPEARWKV